MRRALPIAAALFGAAVVIAAGLIGYAFVNLSSIVAARRRLIVARLSDALGRAVDAGQIDAHAGWGVSIEVTGLRIADSPAFGQLPLLAASRVSIRVALLPLLRRRIRVSTLDLIKPDLRVVRRADGLLNLATLGAGRGAAARDLSAALGGLSIAALRIDDGSLHYIDQTPQGASLDVRHIDLALANFGLASPFALDLKLAIGGGRQNAELSGKVGALSRQGRFDIGEAPLDLKFDLRALTLDRLRTLPTVGQAIPAPLSMPDPVSLSGTLKGTPADIAFAANTDLSADRIVYGAAFSKPAGTPMKLKARGRLAAGALAIASATLKLADLELTAVSLGGGRPPGAQIDTNRFGLSTLAAMAPAAAPLGISGKSEIHGSVALEAGVPDFDAAVALENVALKPARRWPLAITNLNGSVRITHRQAAIDGATFTLGSARAAISARVDSIAPLKANYALTADSLRPADLFAGRPRAEILNALSLTGTAEGALDAPRLSAKIASREGWLANAAYRNLDLTATYASGHVFTHPLKVEVFGGAVTADADVAVAQPPRFTLALAMRSINVKQALRSQGLEAANIVHGLLSGNLTVSGSGAQWAHIRPTLSGGGRLALAEGKLIGVNIVANAINAVGRAPGVSQIVDAAFMSSHHGLLVDPNTELNAASMTFQLAGARFTTHDLAVRSPDYAIRGNGWFDMDKRINMAADITFSAGLQVALPVIVTGKLPAVLVLPDVPELTKRVAMAAIGIPGALIQGGVSTLERGAGAVGGLVGGGVPQPPSIPNPLDTLKKLWP